MKRLCQDVGQQTKVQIEFESHDSPASLSPGISLCLYRVLQEALRNSAKHSGTAHAEVRLWGTPDHIHLTVSDRGIGFDTDTTKAGPGLGLVSMEERLKLLQGTLSVESEPNRGTTIHARVPLSTGIHSKPTVA